jgi:hypothetical protein
VALKCAVVSLWAFRKRRRKNSLCIREEVNIMEGRKKIVLIVRVLLPIAIDFTMRSNPQGGVKVPGI